jgi:hypothetical protein
MNRHVNKINLKYIFSFNLFSHRKYFCHYESIYLLFILQNNENNYSSPPLEPQWQTNAIPGLVQTLKYKKVAVLWGQTYVRTMHSTLKIFINFFFNFDEDFKIKLLFL